MSKWRTWWLYRNIGHFGEEMPDYIDSLEAQVIDISAHDSLVATCNVLGERIDDFQQFVKDFVAKCDGIKIEPNSFTRMNLDDFYDRARALLENSLKDSK